MQLESEIAASIYLYGQPMNLTWHSSDFYRLPCTTWDVNTYNQFAYKHGHPYYHPVSFDPKLGYNPEEGGRWPFPLDAPVQKNYFLTALPLPPDGRKSAIPATDSAAAATALATGLKTDGGNLSWAPGDPPDGSLKTIAEIMREQKGASIGVASTVPFSHATPAAFVSHNISRSDYHRIAEEIIKETRPEVVTGGGYPGESGTNKFTYITESLYNELKNGLSVDYLFVERQKGKDGGRALLEVALKARESRKKLFGLFGGPDGSFEPPLPENNPGDPAIKRQTIENPLLKDVVEAALTVLSANPSGFFVMFEQGDIDWANHDHDYPHMIGAVWDLNEAVKAAIEFVNRPGDDLDWSNTMLVVTADHATGHLRLKRDESGKLLLRKGELPQRRPAKGSLAGQYDLVTYSTTGHTNEPVMVYVFGKGRGAEFVKKFQGTWYPGTEIIDNTQLARALGEAAGLRNWPTPEK
ncbi:MAG: alkaline phosphatase [Candidatus Saccharicenans sp.]|nr:alkaline phosphatase [Candidatus Saccharicenans sp.]